MGIKYGYFANDGFIQAFNNLQGSVRLKIKNHIELHKFAEKLSQEIKAIQPRAQELFSRKDKKEISDEDFKKEWDEMNNCESELEPFFDFESLKEAELSGNDLRVLSPIFINVPAELKLS